MAKFAQLDNSNIVIEVLNVSDSDCNGGTFPESEQAGITFLTNLTGKSNWKQTSIDGSFRKNYAGIGMFYDETRDAFIPQQPFPSWTLNESTCQFDPPTPCPDLTGWYWDEDNTTWVSWDS